MSLQYGISTLKFNYRDTRKRCEKCSKLTIKNTRATSTDIFIDTDDFEYVHAGWVRSSLNDNYTYSAMLIHCFNVINTSAIEKTGCFKSGG